MIVQYIVMEFVFYFVSYQQTGDGDDSLIVSYLVVSSHNVVARLRTVIQLEDIVIQQVMHVLYKLVLVIPITILENNYNTSIPY